MLIKVKDGIIEKINYSYNQLKADNPQVSFPSIPSDELLAEYGVIPVKSVAKPNTDYTKNIKQLSPQLIDGTWTEVWEVTDASYEEILDRVLKLRASEYPPMSDYLDGIVKGDQAQVDKYIADCLAVKAKYPKP